MIYISFGGYLPCHVSLQSTPQRANEIITLNRPVLLEYNDTLEQCAEILQKHGCSRNNAPTKAINASTIAKYKKIKNHNVQSVQNIVERVFEQETLMTMNSTQ